MNKNTIIVILAILVLGMGGFLVYDKVLVNDTNKKEAKEENVKNDEMVEETKIEQKDAEYFNEYLDVFMNCNGKNVSRNTENFNDTDISNFVINYIIQKVVKEDNSTNASGKYTYKATETEIDDLVNKYFNTKSYNIKSVDSVTMVSKVGSNYNFEWAAVGCGYTQYKNPVVDYDGLKVTVKYDLYDAMSDEYTGTSTFYLKYNDGNYNIIKIEE